MILLNFSQDFALFDKFYVCMLVIMVTAFKFKNETGLTKSNI